MWKSYFKSPTTKNPVDGLVIIAVFYKIIDSLGFFCEICDRVLIDISAAESSQGERSGSERSCRKRGSPSYSGSPDHHKREQKKP